MQKSIRQSMASLHSWTGLLLGWLLFAIFLMGSTAYYRHNLNLWMQPALAQIQVNQETALNTAYQYLQNEASHAKTWYLEIATQEKPFNKMYWQKQDGSYGSALLNPATGQELKLSGTQGGEFFYLFHFQLFGIPVLIGRLIACFAALIMLIALISGIITHKKILTDFFTFRTFKGQRSWLDFHNICSVIALPFFLTITFTGLAILFYLYLPWSLEKFYPENKYQYFEEINQKILTKADHPKPAAMLPIQQVLAISQQQWGITDYARLEVKNPNTTSAKITLVQSTDYSITRDAPQLTVNGISGQIITDTKNRSAIATLNSGVYGLHMATFAQPLLRFALFFSGILGCLMIASGLLLWSLKRHLQNKTQAFHLGFYLVDRLNVATFIGLPTAMLCYLYANRLVSVQPGGTNYEIYSFFISWLILFILAIMTKKQWLWKIQLAIFICLAFSLPIYDLYYLSQQNYISGLSHYWNFLRIDLMLWLFAFLAFFIYRNIEPIQLKSSQKLSAKIIRNTQEVNS